MTDDSIRTLANDLLHRLEAAWNAGDGAAFAAPFAEDADFVDITGTHTKGRQAIDAGHRGIFASIYKGSQVRYELLSGRPLAPGLLLVHARAHLDAPGGPLAGKNDSTLSAVVREGAGGFEIAAFHNTLVMKRG
jgi:uncharacterized protein (TIGR02246 family)